MACVQKKAGDNAINNSTRSSITNIFTEVPNSEPESTKVTLNKVLKNLKNFFDTKRKLFNFNLQAWFD